MRTKHNLCAGGLLCFLTFLVCEIALAQGPALPNASSSSRFGRWTFNENFRQGLDGWTSYILAQDVAFDPLISIARQGGTNVLVRSVSAEGQRVLHVVVLWPFQFHVAPDFSIECSYALEKGGAASRLRLLVAGIDGSRHTVLLPRTEGVPKVRVTGNSLGFPSSGIDVEAIVIEANVDHPVFGSRNRLTIREFSVNAQRPWELLLQRPKVARSTVDNVSVTEKPVSKEFPLRLVATSERSIKVSLYNGTGEFVRSERISPLPGRHRAEALIDLGRKPRPGLWRAELKSASAHSVFRFLVLGKVPRHPRILLTCADTSSQ